MAALTDSGLQFSQARRSFLRIRRSHRLANRCKRRSWRLLHRHHPRNLLTYADGARPKSNLPSNELIKSCCFQATVISVRWLHLCSAASTSPFVVSSMFTHSPTIATNYLIQACMLTRTAVGRACG
jgi:hypothetical protein